MKRLAVALLAVLAACGGQGDRLVVAAGTTLVDSGFMDAVVDRYEATTGSTVSVVGESSARVVELGRQGEAGLLLTHEPNALKEFMDEGGSAGSSVAFESRFVLVGPSNLVAGLDGLTVPKAFEEIAHQSWPFVARGDESGTSIAELAIWESLGLDPVGESWYEETGQGMGPTLQVADQRDAFTVADEGTWLETAARLGLARAELVGSDLLANPYSITLVAGQDTGGAQAFFDWLTGVEGADAVTDVSQLLFGSDVYRPFSVGSNG